MKEYNFLILRKFRPKTEDGRRKFFREAENNCYLRTKQKMPDINRTYLYFILIRLFTAKTTALFQ